MRKRQSIISGTTIRGVDSDTDNNDDQHPIEDITDNSSSNESSLRYLLQLHLTPVDNVVADPPKTEFKP